MAEIGSSDAASGRSPKARWHMIYDTPASFTCFFNASPTVETDPTKQCPSSTACSNGGGRLGGAGKSWVRARCVNVSNQRSYAGMARAFAPASVRPTTMLRTMPSIGMRAPAADVALQRERYASVMPRIAALRPMHAMLILLSAAHSAVSGLVVPYQSGG